MNQTLKFKYKKVKCSSELGLSKLNLLGQQGFELSSLNIESLAFGMKEYNYLFKKQITVNSKQNQNTNDK